MESGSEKALELRVGGACTMSYPTVGGRMGREVQGTDGVYSKNQQVFALPEAWLGAKSS